MTAGPRSRDGQLLRVLGVWGLGASIVNITVGGGIFRLPAAAAAILGAAAPLAYLVCAVAMGLIVLCVAEAGSRVSLTGGTYAYVEVAFGPFVGFLTGVLLWAGITAALAAVASFFVDSLAALVPGFAEGAVRATTLVLVLAGLSILNIRGVKGANSFNATMTMAKLLPLGLLIVVGAFAVRGTNLAWNGLPGFGAVARASTVSIFAFMGVETALVPSGEVRDPSRTVPRAIFYAMLVIVTLYITTHLVAQGVLGAALARSKTPLADAASATMGPWGRTAILVGSTISMLGYMSGTTLAIPRMLFAFARDGFLPQRLAIVHPRFRTPHWAITVQALVVILLATTGSFEQLAIVANGSVLLVYAACCVAAMELRHRDVRAGGDPFRVPAGGAVPVLALAVIGWLLVSLRRDEWLAVLMVVAAASGAYLVRHTRRRRGAALTT